MSSGHLSTPSAVLERMPLAGCPEIVDVGHQYGADVSQALAMSGWSRYGMMSTTQLCSQLWESEAVGVVIDEPLLVFGGDVAALASSKVPPLGNAFFDVEKLSSARPS